MVAQGPTTGLFCHRFGFVGESGRRWRWELRGGGSVNVFGGGNKQAIFLKRAFLGYSPGVRLLSSQPATSVHQSPFLFSVVFCRHYTTSTATAIFAPA